MNFINTATVADEKCCLYNGTVLCSSSCKVSRKKLTCEFTGNECKADSVNPSTKYYHALLCGVCESSNAAAQLSAAYNEDFTSNSLTKLSILKLLLLFLEIIILNVQCFYC